MVRRTLFEQLLLQDDKCTSSDSKVSQSKNPSSVYQSAYDDCENPLENIPPRPSSDNLMHHSVIQPRVSSSATKVSKYRNAIPDELPKAINIDPKLYS